MKTRSAFKSSVIGLTMNLAVTACFSTPTQAAESTNAHANILIVTGQDYPAHKWRETAPVLREILEQDTRLSVRIVEDPQFLDSPAVHGYDVLLLHFQNWEVPAPTVEARDNLTKFVEAGGGLVSVHFACGAWHGEWPGFEDLVGRVWRGPNGSQHDPRGPFLVRIVDSNHPVTLGLEDFETDDELYTCLVGDQPIEVLADARSKVDEQNHPMAFVREAGKGRVFLTTLGHDVKAFTSGSVPRLIRQGCLWTAGLPIEPKQ